MENNILTADKTVTKSNPKNQARTVLHGTPHHNFEQLNELRDMDCRRAARARWLALDQYYDLSMPRRCRLGCLREDWDPMYGIFGETRLLFRLAREQIRHCWNFPPFRANPFCQRSLELHVSPSMAERRNWYFGVERAFA